nr:vhs domain-containing protein [Quercus suber]
MVRNGYVFWAFYQYPCPTRSPAAIVPALRGLPALFFFFKAYLHFTHGGSTFDLRTRYWRSRMIDGATSDEDKVTPVYRLEDIWELLKSSHASIVNEVSRVYSQAPQQQ